MRHLLRPKQDGCDFCLCFGLVYGGKRNISTTKTVFWMLISVLFFYFFKQDLFEQKKRRALQKIITLG